MNLGHYLRLGRGEEKSGGRSKTAVLVDALEAILAAIYLDGGMHPVREFILREILAPELERMERKGGALPMTDFKSALQETLQGLGMAQPSYVLVEEAGPEHRKTFTVEVRLQAKKGTAGRNSWDARRVRPRRRRSRMRRGSYCPIWRRGPRLREPSWREDRDPWRQQ